MGAASVQCSWRDMSVHRGRYATDTVVLYVYVCVCVCVSVYESELAFACAVVFDICYSLHSQQLHSHSAQL
jgi:hypothetical protein